MEKLSRSRVAVFGLGGVGSYAVEALARSGVGALDLIDSDRVALSNLNRQIIATAETVGMPKVDAAEARIRSINPDCTVRKSTVFFLPENAGEFDFAAWDYVADAIDTVSGKIALVLAARAAGTPIISAMGTGNKLDPSLLRVSDIYETSMCPLARVMRRELKKRGVERLQVVWSPEEPLTPEQPEEDPPEGRRSVPGSSAFVPAAAGLLMASAVVRDLIGTDKG
jgi:tRNA A37 threonylcarbamoyladenosine dehydratase